MMALSLRGRAWILGTLGGLVAGSAVSWVIRPPASHPKAVSDQALAGNPRDLYRVAAAQVGAVRRDDFPGAYACAARSIRARFPLPEFTRMMCETYPLLRRPGGINFGAAQFLGSNRASTLVYLTGVRSHTPVIFTYIKEEDGWKIDGVEFIHGGEPIPAAVGDQT